MIATPGNLSRRAQLYHQLGSMLSAGVPLLQALDMTSRNPAARSSHKTIHNLINGMQSGLTFTESMSQANDWMPEFDTALLSVGEQSGRLDQCFKLLSAYYESRARIIRDTITGLITTAATVHVFILVFPLNYLIGFVQGIFTNNYSLCIPFLVEKAAVFGGLYLTIFLLIFACQGQRGETWRAMVENISSVIPVLGTARKYLTLSRLAASMEASVSSGLSAISGWELAGIASGSPYVRRLVTSWKPHFDAGSTAEMINQSSYFPEMFGNFYFTGEQSGRLDDALHRLQIYYQDEGFHKLRFFTRLMNGTIYGLVVLLVAYNVIRFYMGYFSIIQSNMN